MDLRKWSPYLMAAFYIVAGLWHFIMPAFYYPLIPDYFVYPELINGLAGACELLLGVGLMFVFSRKISAYLIIIMLCAFVPSHVHFIQIGSCVPDGLCVPAIVGWFRLVIIHPLLIYWAWRVRNVGKALHGDRKIIY